MTETEGGGPRRSFDATVSPLVRSKLRPPPTPPHYIRRARLLEVLDESSAVPITVVAAPAGAGKTSLVAGWTAETDIAHAWLSVDSVDRDAVSFWSGVTGALDRLVPGCGDKALAVLRAHHPVDEFVAQLLDELDGDHEPSALVIDDLHLVDDEASIATSFAMFLDHLPSWLHAILVARRDPVLPLDRLRARGQLRELRMNQLTFSPDEARALLTRLTPKLSGDVIDGAVERVDGWAAGLQMVALAARAEQVQQPAEPPLLDVGRRLVHDYVMNEVLATEPDELVDTLLDLAVADRFDAAFARALTRRTDVVELVRRAESRGLFVTVHEPEGCFVIHPMVRSVLVAELAERSADDLVEQRVRAARWLEDAGDTPAALTQWQLADRPRDVLRLLAARHAELYDTGREAVILRTIDWIPPEVALADLEAAAEFAWCHLLVSRRRFLELVEELDWRAGRTRSDPALAARVTVLRSIAATARGDWAAGGRLAHDALDQLGDGWWRDYLGRFAWNMLVRELALSERWDDAADDVRDAKYALGRDPSRQLAFEGTRALGLALSGRPVDALRVAAGIRQVAEVSNRTILRVELAMAEALAHRELGDRKRAVDELEALAGAPAETMLHCRVLAMFELVDARLGEGNVAAARELFAAAEAMVLGELPGRGACEWLARAGVMVSIATADLERARFWTTQIADPFWSAASSAKVHLAAGERADARVALADASPRGPRHDVVLALLEARALDDPSEAMKRLSTAVEVAAVNGLVQTIASEGTETVELIERVAWQAPEHWMDRLRRVAAEARPDVDHGQVGLVEPLTERERDVLRFLPSRLTVREIADELHVSVNTLKFHLKVIYRKLGVSSRDEAARVARKMTEPR